MRLGQDEDFECQVLPGPKATVKVPLRASVHIAIQGGGETEKRNPRTDSVLCALGGGDTLVIRQLFSRWVHKSAIKFVSTTRTYVLRT